MEKRRGRPALDRGKTLENFVKSLVEKYGSDGPYNRDQLETIGDKNQLGLSLFTAKKTGHGNETRVSHGLYKIPANWNLNPPWKSTEVKSEVVVENSDPVVS